MYKLRYNAWDPARIAYRNMLLQKVGIYLIDYAKEQMFWRIALILRANIHNHVRAMEWEVLNSKDKEL